MGDDAATDTQAEWIKSPSGRVLRLGAVALAIILQLVVLVPFTVASGLVAPLWAIVVLYGLWFAAALLLVRMARRRPFATPLVPLANGLLVWLTITLGEMWLGWTA